MTHRSPFQPLLFCDSVKLDEILQVLGKATKRGFFVKFKVRAMESACGDGTAPWFPLPRSQEEVTAKTAVLLQEMPGDLRPTLPAAHLEKGLEPARSVPPSPTPITPSTPPGTLGAAGGSPGLCSARSCCSQGKRPVRPPLQARTAQEEEEAWLAARAAAHPPDRQGAGSAPGVWGTAPVWCPPSVC